MEAIDLSIARYIREQKEQQKQEMLRAEREKYDKKKQISYTVEELAEGVRSGTLYLYTLKLGFEKRGLFDGKFYIPFIKDFFDVMEEGPGDILYGCNKRKVSVVIALTQCVSKVSFDGWMKQIRDSMKRMGIPMKTVKVKKTGKMEYFCHETPTPEGKTFNILFRYQKGKEMYTGSLNCMQEDRDGMGLLLEALVLVAEEMNQGGSYGY